MKFLVFTTDVIPLPGVSTSGTALRTWGIAQGLKCHGHEVVLSVPKPALQAFLKNNPTASLPIESREELRKLESLAFHSGNQAQIISDVNPDVILCGHWTALTLSHKPSQPVVIDLAGPHLLERHYQKSPNQLGAALAKLSVIGAADYFLVSGPSQRLYFLSYILRAEIPDAAKRICTLTMALDPNVPKRAHATSIGETYPRMIFGGVFLPWQNPSFGLEELGSRLLREQSGSLTLVGGKHPNYPIEEGVYAELFAKLSKNPRVTTKPLLSYEKFCAELSNADVAIDLMKWNLERQFAVTIRTTTYLWAGVPVIYNDFADLAEVIKNYNAGWTVPTDDPKALSAVFDEIWNSPAVVQEKSRNATRIAQDLFSWDRAVQPLLEMVGTSLPRLREIDILFDYPGNAELAVTKDKPVQQLFRCRVNGLTKVECRIATHGRTIRKPLRVNLFEVNDNSRTAFPIAVEKQRLLGSYVADGDSLRNNDWFSVEVPAQAESAGKLFVLEMSAEEEQTDQALSPWALNSQPYPLLSLRHGDRLVENTALCIRTICTNAGHLT